jgi:hypothetical protein
MRKPESLIREISLLVACSLCLQTADLHFDAK